MTQFFYRTNYKLVLGKYGVLILFHYEKRRRQSRIAKCVGWKGNIPEQHEDCQWSNQKFIQDFFVIRKTVTNFINDFFVFRIIFIFRIWFFWLPWNKKMISKASTIIYNWPFESTSIWDSPFFGFIRLLNVWRTSFPVPLIFVSAILIIKSTSSTLECGNQA